MKLNTLDAEPPGLCDAASPQGPAAGFLGLAAALGSGLAATASAADPATLSGIILGCRLQRVPAHRVLVLLGRHRAGGRGRPDRRARRRRVPGRTPSPSRPPAAANIVTAAASTATRRSTACRRTRRTPTASAPRATGPRRTPSRRRTSRATSTSCSSATRRSARRATWRRTAPVGRTPWTSHSRPTRTPSCWCPAVTRSRPPTPRRSGTRSSHPTSCVSTRGPPPSATTTSAARPTSSTSGPRTPTARHRSTQREPGGHHVGR